MKIYQCIRAYDPYIPAFESKYQIKDKRYSFNELRDLLLLDGFAATYILKPAYEENNKEFFFTFWNYKTLQYKWAEENGINTRNLDEIRLAQVEIFKPDVYYNFSTYYDSKILSEILNKKDLIKICWDATINYGFPPFHESYNLRATLFEPYVRYWNQHGLNSFLLPPAFPHLWNNLDRSKKNIDILFYGQLNEHFFSERNVILEELIKWNNKKGFNLELHIQLPRKKKPLINIRGFNKYAHWVPAASRVLRNSSLSPIYGQELYETIARSKIVINAFGNYNGLFKENMRNYECTGCGAILISEDGIYPEHFIPNKDFYTYRSTNELFNILERTLLNPEQGIEMAKGTREKLKIIYSKEEQWNTFIQSVKAYI